MLKYRSEITEPKTNNLDYLINPVLTDCLYFPSKMVMMILQEIRLRVLHAISRNQRF